MAAIHFVLGLTILYFGVELVVGLWLGSLTLRADAFHMLSDMIALSIGIWSERASQRPPCTKATYGWSRSTVVGALINVAFLLGNAFSILTEAVTHFFEDPNENLTDKDNALTLIIVASIGLLINLVGILLISCCSSSGGGVRGSHSHSHSSHGSSSATSHANRNHSTLAVLLHLFADFFGSVAALASALVMRYWTSWDDRAIMDLILSLVVVALICASALPVLKETIHILLQKTPKGSDLDVIEREIDALDNVTSVHHLHLWEMGTNKRVASLHVHPSGDLYTSTNQQESLHFLRRRIQTILHRHGYHSSTIQFDHAPEEHCELNCSDDCRDAQCCSPTRHHDPSFV